MMKFFFQMSLTSLYPTMSCSRGKRRSLSEPLLEVQIMNTHAPYMSGWQKINMKKYEYHSAFFLNDSYWRQELEEEGLTATV